MRFFVLERPYASKQEGCHGGPQKCIQGPQLSQLAQLGRPAASQLIEKGPSHPPTPAQDAPNAPAATRVLRLEMKTWSRCRRGSALPWRCRSGICSHFSPSSTSKMPPSVAREPLEAQRKVQPARARSDGGGRRREGSTGNARGPSGQPHRPHPRPFPHPPRFFSSSRPLSIGVQRHLRDARGPDWRWSSTAEHISTASAAAAQAPSMAAACHTLNDCEGDVDTGKASKSMHAMAQMSPRRTRSPSHQTRRAVAAAAPVPRAGGLGGRAAQRWLSRGAWGGGRSGLPEKCTL